MQGKIGYANWGSDESEIGITMALAYPTNVEDSGIFNNKWKGDEWSSDATEPFGNKCYR